MCGLAGFFKADSFQTGDELVATVARMTAPLVHRGPNDVGHWCDVGHGVALGHRRLSILDVSAAGHQPMQSVSGRYVLVFNGEIYNHLQLRDELDERPCWTPWRGGSEWKWWTTGFIYLPRKHRPSLGATEPRAIPMHRGRLSYSSAPVPRLWRLARRGSANGPTSSGLPHLC